VWIHSRSRSVSGAALSAALLCPASTLAGGLRGVRRGSMEDRSYTVITCWSSGMSIAASRQLSGRSIGSGACGAHRSARSRVGLAACRRPAQVLVATGDITARGGQICPPSSGSPQAPPLRTHGGGGLPTPPPPPSPTTASRSMAERMVTREPRATGGREPVRGAYTVTVIGSLVRVWEKGGLARGGGGVGGLGEAATTQTATARLERDNQELDGLRAEPGSSSGATSTCAGAGRRPALPDYERCDGRRRRPSKALT
jgi:hypothetical protein